MADTSPIRIVGGSFPRPDYQTQIDEINLKVSLLAAAVQALSSATPPEETGPVTDIAEQGYPEARG